MTDSTTTSEGWLRKMICCKTDNNATQAAVRIDVARKHNCQFITYGIKEYIQWFPGSENNVADAHSRDWDRSDDKLTNILFPLFPSQMPKNFKIVPLSNEIAAEATSEVVILS